MKMISSDSISDLVSDEEREFDRRVQKGRTSVISWLGISRKSSGRIAEYLKRQDYDPIVIECILSSLIDDGTIDDIRLAKNIARQRQGRQAESRMAMAHRMRRLGLADDAVEEALPDIEQDLEAACQLLEKRFGQLLAAQGSRSDLARKAARFLAGRGFTQSTIITALRKYTLTIDSED